MQVEDTKYDIADCFGKKVYATMDGSTWVEGILREQTNLFVQFGVEVDGAIKYFVDCVLHEDE